MKVSKETAIAELKKIVGEDRVITDPEVLKNVLFTRVDVDISGGFADGMTIVDTRHFHNLPDNCHVALSADRDLFNKILFERVASFK